MPPRSHLIDVRSPAEFTSIAGLPGAVNLEYHLISNLSSVTGAEPHDAITLYCASGGRSAAALRELQLLGYTNARNLGDLENAKRVLEAEESNESNKDNRTGSTSVSEPSATQSKQVKLRVTGCDRQELKESWTRLLEGLAKEGGGTLDEDVDEER